MTNIDYEHNNPKYSDRQSWANKADQDKTAHKSLQCLPFAYQGPVVQD